MVPTNLQAVIAMDIVVAVEDCAWVGPWRQCFVSWFSYAARRRSILMDLDIV